MSNKFIVKVKRIVSSVLAISVLSTAIPMDLAMADEIPQKYPYTLFAASSDEGAISVNASNFCVNGNIATNGTITTEGNMNINGSIGENASESMKLIRSSFHLTMLMNILVNIFLTKQMSTLILQPAQLVQLSAQVTSTSMPLLWHLRM